MLIDVHAHFFTERSGKADWRDYNRRRLSAGARVGITAHVASILGTWGARSPVYFASPADVTPGNEAMRALQREHPGLIYGYCHVNPNYQDHALAEIARGASLGMIGVKLAAARRADDALLDPIVRAAGWHRLPVLHHIWQHRRREWPGQEASDGVELARLASRHPDTTFILAHLGGGGDWAHTLRAVASVPNVYLDLSGSGVDAGMLEASLASVGVDRLLWGADVTIDTGWAKLRFLDSLGLPAGAMDAIRAGNAARIFPPGVLQRGD